MSPGCAATTGVMFDAQECLRQMGHFIIYQMLHNPALHRHYLSFCSFFSLQFSFALLHVPLFTWYEPNCSAQQITNKAKVTMFPSLLELHKSEYQDEHW